jgi:mono/diheme cytochrome c family protein
MRRILAAVVVAALAAITLAACDKEEPAPISTAAATASSGAPATPSATSSAAPAASPDTKVQQIFATRCASCHGPKGKGDGPIAASLTPRPRDYSDAAWQRATPDDAIAAIIARGGSAVHESPMMPPSPDLAADPAALAAMVKLVRSFGGKT